MAEIIRLTPRDGRPIPLLLFCGSTSQEKRYIIQNLLRTNPTLRIETLRINRWHYPEDQQPYHTASEGTTRDLRRIAKENNCDLAILELENPLRIHDFLMTFLGMLPNDLAKLRLVQSFVQASDVLRVAARTKSRRLTPYTVNPAIQQLLHRIEYCDRLYLRGMQTLAEEQQKLTRHFVQLLQPRAELIEECDWEQSQQFILKEWFELDMTPFGSSCDQLKWASKTQGDNLTLAPIPNCMVYRRNEPFDYGKLLDVLKTFPDGIIRGIGSTYLRTRIECELAFDHLRGHFISLCLPTEDRLNENPSQTEIVFLGGGNQHAELEKRLDDCLCRNRIFAVPHLQLIPN